MGERARETGQLLVVEYWNEPYLNWANLNRANFIPRFFDESRAEEGGPVHILHDGSEAPFLIWTRDRRHLQHFMLPGGLQRRYPDLDHWRRGRRADGTVLSTSAQPYRSMEFYYGPQAWNPASHPPLNVPDGDTYEFQGETLTAFTPWHIIDTTQFTYWSGKGMRKFYIDPMLAFGRAMKEENPESIFIVGWGNRPGEDHWAGFTQLYQATIDAGIDIIDGYNDHDYGGHPANMGAQYEVMTAYGMTRHNKWLYAYNTETGANTDPQVYRDQATVSPNIGKFEWVTAKMMHAMAKVPDKARVFLHFGDGQHTGAGGGGWWSDKGEGIAMEMMLNLRGRLLHTRGMREDLFIVATIDGTDPLAPRPERLGPGKELVVAVWNDTQQPRPVDIHIASPAGADLGPGRVLFSDRLDREVQVTEEARIFEGEHFEEQVLLGPRQLRVYTFPLTNSGELSANPSEWPGALPSVRRRQFFGHTLIQDVHADAPVEETLDLPGELLEQAESAEFAFVARRLPADTAFLLLNGHRIPLPAVIPPENNDALRRISLPVDLLRKQNTVRIEVPDADSPGFFLGKWSLWIETR